MARSSRHYTEVPGFPFRAGPACSLATAEVLRNVESFPAPSLDCAGQLAIKVLEL